MNERAKNIGAILEGLHQDTDAYVFLENNGEEIVNKINALHLGLKPEYDEENWGIYCYDKDGDLIFLITVSRDGKKLVFKYWKHGAPEVGDKSDITKEIANNIKEVISLIKEYGK